MLLHACNPTTQEAMTEELRFGGQFETLCVYIYMYVYGVCMYGKGKKDMVAHPFNPST